MIVRHDGLKDDLLPTLITTNTDCMIFNSCSSRRVRRWTRTGQHEWRIAIGIDGEEA